VCEPTNISEAKTALEVSAGGLPLLVLRARQAVHTWLWEGLDQSRAVLPARSERQLFIFEFPVTGVPQIHKGSVSVVLASVLACELDPEHFASECGQEHFDLFVVQGTDVAQPEAEGARGVGHFLDQ
jgi:hypothetical protein